MEDTEVKVEEQVTEGAQPLSAEETISNYKAILEEQQAQIKQLLQQQEVNKKIQAQNAELLKDFVNKESEKNQQHWVDKVLANELKFEANNDPSKNYSKFMNGTGKDIATWWLQYYKEQGLSNEEISSRYKRMAESMDTGVQPHEEIPD